MESLHSRKAEERPSPEQKGRQDASEKFSAVVGSAVGLAASFMSYIDSCESFIHSLSSLVAIQRLQETILVTFWILLLKAWALGDSNSRITLPPAIHEMSCTEVGKVLNWCIRIAFTLKFLLGLFFNMTLLFSLIRQDHINSWHTRIHQ